VNVCESPVMDGYLSYEKWYDDIMWPYEWFNEALSTLWTMKHCTWASHSHHRLLITPQPS
jgi:hypothetical protein